MKEPYYSFSAFLRKKFGAGKIRKIAIDAGFPCPNKDGTVSSIGCIFCDTYGSGPIYNMKHSLSIEEQIESFIGNRRDRKYIAYYQPHSNTCAPLNILKQRYEIIFQYPEIIGFFIGTRPDAIADNVYPLLEELNRRTFLTVELGLQSIHTKSLDFLNRNHSYDQFLDTFFKLKNLGIDVLVHLIVGIPGETHDDILASVKEMNRLKPAGVKFHVMHVLKNTRLFDLYNQNQFQLMEREEYIDLIIRILEHLDPGTVVHRLTGERDKEIFVAPQWTTDKGDLINTIRSRMQKNHTYQGRLLSDNHS
jgi:radical SAM protein (TIGR01212 family)